MKIVDPHHHLWDLDNLDYPWLSEPANDDWFIGNYKAIRRNYFPEDYRADTGRYEIVKSVHIDAGHDPSNPLDETVWLSGQAQRTGLPNAFVVSADLSAMDVDTDLARQAAYSQVRGTRQLLNRQHPRHRVGNHRHLRTKTLHVRVEFSSGPFVWVFRKPF